MHKLMREQTVLIPRLEVADSMRSRNKGLLGRNSLPADQALWILQCSSVHTFFMRFKIDLVFLNAKMEVTRTVSKVPPGRLVWNMFRAASVIELSEGFLDKHPIRVGDKLHVDPALS